MRNIEIECCLLGPFHDFKIFLNYSGVQAFSLVTPKDFSGPPAVFTGHGDLLMHEIRLEMGDNIVHELLFSRGSVFQVTFRNLSHRVEPYTASH